MILEDLYPLLVVVHVIGAFLFALAHGVSMAVAFRLRMERDLDRVRTLLDLSAGTVGLVYLSLALLLVAGIVAAIWHNWIRYAWPWLSLAILLLLAVQMNQRGSLHYNAVRRAAGMRTYGDPPDRPAPPVNEPVLWRLLQSARPEELAVTGGLGLVVMVWLMIAKPF